MDHDIHAKVEQHMRALQQLLETHAVLLASHYKQCAICDALDANPTSPDSFYRLCELRDGCACSPDKAICPACFTKQLKTVQWRAEGDPSIVFECPLCRHAIQYAIPTKRARDMCDALDDAERARKTIVPVTLYSFDYVSSYSDAEHLTDDVIRAITLDDSDYQMFSDIVNMRMGPFECVDDCISSIKFLRMCRMCPTTWPAWLQDDSPLTVQDDACLRGKVNLFTSYGTKTTIDDLEEHNGRCILDLPDRLGASTEMIESWIIATQPPRNFNHTYVVRDMRFNVNGYTQLEDPIGVFLTEDNRNYNNIYNTVLRKIFEEKEPVIPRGPRWRWIDRDLESFFKLVHKCVLYDGVIVDKALFQRLCSQPDIPLSATTHSNTALLKLVLNPDSPSSVDNPLSVIEDAISGQLLHMPTWLYIDSMTQFHKMLDTFGWALYLAYLRECVFKFE